ncbi:MAG TPA: helix-turn-helix transcriptional regulator [Patescibacteria group bacterium]|nr:helix-turn-helix transcriptional regulator [Patescibacteria group bacterium]
MGNVNNKLRYHRRMRDLTQDDLGAALDVTRHTIMAIEKRKYEPSIALALKIAAFFGVPVEEMFFLEEVEKPCSD